MGPAFSSCSIKAPAPSADRAWWKKAALIVLVILAVGEGVRTLGHEYRLMLDLQDIPCLPARIMVVQLGRPDHVAIGDVVAFTTDRAAPYFTASELLGKRVAALPGDRYAVVAHQLFINNIPSGRLTLCDNKPLARYCEDRSGVVGKDNLLLLADHPLSFDGRYWGPILMTRITGRVIWPDLRTREE